MAERRQPRGGVAGAVRQPFHRHRAAEMGELLERTAVVDQHQGAARLLLRGAGRRRAAGGQRAPHPRPPRLPSAVRPGGRRRRCRLRPGDVAVTNHPAYGGSHLPDVTVVTPVFAAEPACSATSRARAHHAEIGGARPGSMPPDATRLAEEGVVIPPTLLVAPGSGALGRRSGAGSARGPYPSRAVEENLADLAAAVAATATGAGALARLADAHGAATVRRAMAALGERAAERPWSAGAARLGDGHLPGREQPRRRHPARGRDARSTGAAHGSTSAAPPAVHPGNLNATPAIVTCGGALRAAPAGRRAAAAQRGPARSGRAGGPGGAPGAAASPTTRRQRPAVVGGNVETSQRLVDTAAQGARPRRLQSGHHEQPDLRQRALRLLRDGLRRLRAPDRGSPERRRRRTAT